MVKRKIKEEIKRPDIVIATVELAITFIRTHLVKVIIAAAVFCAAGLSVYAYTAYEERKNEKAQTAIFEGVKSLESFNRSGKKEDLDKAEAVFQKAAKERAGKVYMVAELYLGTVYAVKGQNDEARKIYQRLAKDGPTVLKMLSERALQNLAAK
jgi:hypothetical protein